MPAAEREKERGFGQEPREVAPGRSGAVSLHTGSDGSAAALPLGVDPEDAVGEGWDKLLLSDLFT